MVLLISEGEDLVSSNELPNVLFYLFRLIVLRSPPDFSMMKVIPLRTGRCFDECLCPFLLTYDRVDCWSALGLEDWHGWPNFTSGWPRGNAARINSPSIIFLTDSSWSLVKPKRPGIGKWGVLSVKAYGTTWLIPLISLKYVAKTTRLCWLIF